MILVPSRIAAASPSGAKGWAASSRDPAAGADEAARSGRRRPRLEARSPPCHRPRRRPRARTTATRAKKVRLAPMDAIPHRVVPPDVARGGRRPSRHRPRRPCASRPVPSATQARSPVRLPRSTDSACGPRPAQLTFRRHRMDRTIATRSLAAAFVVGAIAQALLVGAELGINIPLLAAATMAAAVFLSNGGRRIDRLDLWLPVAALAVSGNGRDPLRLDTPVPRCRDRGIAPRGVDGRLRRGRGHAPELRSRSSPPGRSSSPGSVAGSSACRLPPAGLRRRARAGALACRRGPVPSPAACSSRSRSSSCSSRCSHRRTRSSRQSQPMSSAGSSTSASCRCALAWPSSWPGSSLDCWASPPARPSSTGPSSPSRCSRWAPPPSNRCRSPRASARPKP